MLDSFVEHLWAERLRDASQAPLGSMENHRIQDSLSGQLPVSADTCMWHICYVLAVESRLTIYPSHAGKGALPKVSGGVQLFVSILLTCLQHHVCDVFNRVAPFMITLVLYESVLIVNAMTVDPALHESAKLNSAFVYLIVGQLQHTFIEQTQPLQLPALQIMQPNIGFQPFWPGTLARPDLKCASIRKVNVTT